MKITKTLNLENDSAVLVYHKEILGNHIENIEEDIFNETKLVVNDEIEYRLVADCNSYLEDEDGCLVPDPYYNIILYNNGEEIKRSEPMSYIIINEKDLINTLTMLIRNP